MNYEKENTCCFIGHRKIKSTPELRKKVQHMIESMIAIGVTTFLFGSKSAFNDLCYSVVTDLKSKYTNITRVYIRGEFPYINDDYKAWLMESYEDTYYPEVLRSAGKAVYIKRNTYMLDKSRYCVFYYDEQYVPIPYGRSKKAPVRSGTRLAYDYAVSQHKTVFNIFP